MKIAVASGKGGTGKTTFAVNLAYALSSEGESVRLLDCDVEEPNDHLFIKPKFTEKVAVEVMKPIWDESKCTGCGECGEACRFNAIAVIKGKVLIFNELCHACGVCAYVCPEDAINETPYSIGVVQADLLNSKFPFIHGLLNIGEPIAPAVIRDVKKYIDPEAINIIDASPGTACPVVEAVNSADVAVLVTEPTPFGLNDLKLAVNLTLQLGVPTGIVVNRSDGQDKIISDYSRKVGIPIIGRIPFKREYAEAYSRGDILVNIFSDLKENLLGIYQNIKQLVGTSVPPVPGEDRYSIKTDETASFNKGTASDYKEIAIISGKGGTGKTTVVSSLALLSNHKVLADNDVDAADLHLLLKPEIYEEYEFGGGEKASIDSIKCTGCGQCAEYCHFDAIYFNGPANENVTNIYKIDELACEGCGLCKYVCPEDAITFSENITGKWYVSKADNSPMVHARLGIAEENSGKLVTQVRNRAAELARELKMDTIIGDGPPGTGCPVIASVSGVDIVLIVTEPTVSGVHDMERVLKLAAHFGVPALVIINKADLNYEQAQKIHEMAKEAGSRVIATIPFDRNVNDALMAGKTIVEYGKGPAAKAIREVWNVLQKEMT